MNHSRTLAIVIQYGSYDDLRLCLDRLVASSAHSIDVCVVDNNPPEFRDLEMYARDFPSVRLISPEVNQGFSGGCNAALSLHREESYGFFIFLNNDAQIGIEDIERMESILDSMPDVGIVGPVVQNKLNGEQYFGLYVDWNRGRCDYNAEVDASGSQGSVLDVDLVSGCGMMLPKRVLDEVKDFDNRFFLYWEDTDLNVRVRKAGYRTVIATEAHMSHRPSQSTGNDSPLMEYYMTRNSLLFFSLHTSGFFKRNRVIARLMVKRTLKGARQILRGHPKLGKALLFGVFDFVRGRSGFSSRIDHRAYQDTDK